MVDDHIIRLFDLVPANKSGGEATAPPVLPTSFSR